MPHSTDSVPSRSFAPAHEQLPLCSHTRQCPSLSDAAWIEPGVSRVIEGLVSGRGFLQNFISQGNQAPGYTHFFETLKSSRRLKLCEELNERIASSNTHRIPDALATFEERLGQCAHRLWILAKAQTGARSLLPVSRQGRGKDPMGERPWDRKAPINEGIIADRQVGSSANSGYLLRIIEFKFPASGKNQRFVTNEMTLTPPAAHSTTPPSVPPRQSPSPMPATYQDSPDPSGKSPCSHPTPPPPRCRASSGSPRCSPASCNR